MARTIGLAAGCAWRGSAAPPSHSRPAPFLALPPTAPGASRRPPSPLPRRRTTDEQDQHILHRHKMSDVELGRLRMLEIQSGAFHTAHEEAHSQEVVGPPLSDREKVLQAINR